MPERRQRRKTGRGGGGGTEKQREKERQRETKSGETKSGETKSGKTEWKDRVERQRQSENVIDNEIDSVREVQRHGGVGQRVAERQDTGWHSHR